MEILLHYRGRAVTTTDAHFIRALIAAHPEQSRRALSATLCEAWDWRQENGALRAMVCRGLMLALAREGHITLPSVRRTPFFLDPENRSVSAVLFTNQFTVPRFFRLGTALPRHDVQAVIRTGFCYEDAGGPAHSIYEYQYRLGDPRVPAETWSQGVTLFINPEADVPLPDGALPCTSVFEVRQGRLRRIVAGFHTVTSFMKVVVSERQPIGG